VNSLERILATLAGAAVDRRAVTPVLSLYGARLTNCPLERYYNDASAYAKGQSAVREVFEPDALFTPFAFALLGAAFGSKLHYFAEQAPNVRQPIVQNFKDCQTLEFPDFDSCPQLTFLRESVRLMVAEHQAEVPVAAVLPPPIDFPMLIMGLESWLETVLFNPEVALRILERITPFFIRLANALFAEGAAFLALPCGLVLPAIVTRNMLEGFSKPVLQECLPELHGPVILHHAGAPLLEHLDLLTGLPQVVAFALDHQDDLEQTRQIVGPTPVLFGGPCGPNLARQTPQTLERECQGILANRKNDPRFILFTAGADIPLNAPPENVWTLMNTARAFGGADL